MSKRHQASVHCRVSILSIKDNISNNCEICVDIRNKQWSATGGCQSQEMWMPDGFNLAEKFEAARLTTVQLVA